MYMTNGTNAKIKDCCRKEVKNMNKIAESLGAVYIYIYIYHKF